MTINGATYAVLVAAGLAATNSTKAQFETASWINADSDVHFDWQEHIAGTDPTNAASFLAVSLQTNTLAFATASNRNYTVRTCGALGDHAFPF